MITSNTSIPFIKAENSENKFYLSRLTSEYNEGDSITTSTDINCRKLAIAIKAGDKITINGTSLTVYADAAVDATSFFVEEITLDEALNINANIAIDEDNMFVQYQRKTEGTVAGFDIDADGMSKGGVEITGWLDSDTMEGATANNLPTAESVKAYVDASSGGTTPTLQEVTDTGNTTTNSIMIGSSSSPSSILHVYGTTGMISESPANGGITIRRSDNVNYNSLLKYHSGNSEKWVAGLSDAQDFDGSTGNEYFVGTGKAAPKLLIDSSGNVGIGTASPEEKLSVSGSIQLTNQQDLTWADIGDGNTGRVAIRGNEDGDWIMFKTDNSERMRLTNTGLGIGTTSPTNKLSIKATSSSQAVFGIQYSSTTTNFLEVGVAAHDSYLTLKNSGTTEVIKLNSDGDSYFNGGNVGIGTTPSEKLEVDGNIKVGDNDEVRFGTDDDLKMYHNATDSYIENETGNLYILNNADNKDIIFQSDNGSGGVTAYLTLDGSAGYTTVQKNMNFADDVKATFGNDNDLKIDHDSSGYGYIQNMTGHLYLANYADDKDIIFQSDNGSGGTATYLTLDGSQETVNVYKNLLIGTTTDNGYKLDVNGTQRVQDVLELDDVLTLNAISTPDDPDEGKSSIYMDSADGAIKVKINFEGEVVTRTIASFDG
jgi:hypothetical protein